MNWLDSKTSYYYDNCCHFKYSLRPCCSNFEYSALAPSSSSIQWVCIYTQLTGTGWCCTPPNPCLFDLDGTVVMERNTSETTVGTVWLSSLRVASWQPKPTNWLKTVSTLFPGWTNLSYPDLPRPRGIGQAVSQRPNKSQTHSFGHLKLLLNTFPHQTAVSLLSISIYFKFQYALHTQQLHQCRL